MTDPMLCRSVSFETRSETSGDGLTLEGYAAVFDSPTRINSWEGIFDERIAPGAFKKSMRERTPVLQVNHGRSEDLPIGAIESLTEDAKGLHVTARIFDVPDTALLREGIKAQAIHGMSFRFEVVKDEWRDAGGKLIRGEDVPRALYAADPADPATVPMRTLREVKLFELGPVTYPAYGDTSVSLRSNRRSEDDMGPMDAQDFLIRLTEHHVESVALADAYLRLDVMMRDPRVDDIARGAIDAQTAEIALMQGLISQMKRSLRTGTPSKAGEAEGASAEGRAATPTEEPPSALPVARIPSPEARDRALLLESESRNG